MLCLKDQKKESILEELSVVKAYQQAKLLDLSLDCFQTIRF